MADRIGGGWTQPGSSLPNTAFAVTRPPPASGKQHVLSGMSISFNGTPSTPVEVMVIDPDVSPNTLLWDGYVGQSRDVEFPGGIHVPPGHQVAVAVAAGGGSLICIATLYGQTV